jgi:hypothetical protein
LPLRREQGRSKNAPAPFAAVVIDKEKDIDWLLLDEDEQDALANLACVIGEEARHKSLQDDRQPSIYALTINQGDPTPMGDGGRRF